LNREEILAVMARHDLTPKDLERVLGVDASTVRRWLSETPGTHRRPTGLYLRALQTLRDEPAKEKATA
jgi:DNA-binding transcriptional regulator YiaG